MKDLKTILEAIDGSLREKLLGIINGEDFDEATARRMLTAAFKIDKNTQDKIIALLKSKVIDDVNKHITRILKEYDAINLLPELANDGYQFSSSNLTNSSPEYKENIYQLIKRHVPQEIVPSDDCLKELAGLEIAKSNISRGKFEILARLLLTDISNKVGGDVGTIDSGALEFKVGGGRVNGQKPTYAADMYKYAEKFMKSKNIDIKFDKNCGFQSQTAIHGFFNTLASQIGVDVEEWTDFIIGMICSQVKQDPGIISNQFRNVLKNSLFVSKEPIPAPEPIIGKNGKPKKVKPQKINSNVIYAKRFLKLMGCIQLFNYQEEEGWDYIVIFGYKTGEEAVNNGDYICLDKKLASDLQYIYQHNNIDFDGGGNMNGAARDNYCHIYYYPKGGYDGRTMKERF